MGTSAPVIIETWEEPKIFITIPDREPAKAPAEIPVETSVK
jgi:hypothetical protein